VLAQLREVTGPDAAILLGFDRGGSYPAAKLGQQLVVVVGNRSGPTRRLCS